MEVPTVSEACIKNFFTNMPKVEKGQEITDELIESRGVTHRNATGLVSILELLGFIGKEHTPTDIWWSYIDHPQATLQPILKKGVYSCLFERYSEPHKQPPKAISDALRSEYGKGADWGERATRDFLAFWQIANVEQVSQQDMTPSTNGVKNTSVVPDSNDSMSIVTLQFSKTDLLNPDFIGAIWKYIR